MPFYSPYLQFQQEHIKVKEITATSSVPHRHMCEWVGLSQQLCFESFGTSGAYKKGATGVGNNSSNNNNPLLVPAQDFCFLIHQCVNKLC